MKLKKENIFKQVEKTKYIYQPAKEKKGRRVGEITIGITTIAIPVRNFVNNLTPAMYKKMKKVAAGFPNVTINFNFNSEAEAYLVKITAKTECRADDIYNKEVGERIVNSKIQCIALRVAKRMSEEFLNEYRRGLATMLAMSDFFDALIAKEKTYIDLALYLPKQEKE